MATFTVNRGITTPSGTIQESTAYTGQSYTEIDEDIAVGTDVQVTIAIDVSAVKAFYIVSDRAITLETNSGGSPVNTIALLAGIPYFWHTSMYDTFKLTTDVTAMFFTNASGATAAVKVRVLQDPTP